MFWTKVHDIRGAYQLPRPKGRGKSKSQYEKGFLQKVGQVAQK